MSTIIDREALFAILPFMPVDGKAFVYNRENALSEAEFISVDVDQKQPERPPPSARGMGNEMTMIERVARAICGEIGVDYDALPEKATYYQRKAASDAFADRDEALDAARAVIEAMREPTRE